jgi:hypothetical protein
VKIGSQLAVFTRREALVTWWATGHKYGNPRLFQNRFNKHQLTHDAYTKLSEKLQKKGVTLQPGLNFVESLCYQVPKDLLPRAVKEDGKEKVGGGDSGVIVYRFGNVNCRPGSYMLLAASESVASYFIEKLVEAMKARRNVGAKAPMLHTLQMEYIADLLRGSKDPILNYLSGFYERWTKEVHHPDVPSKGDKTTVKQKWLPLVIPFPDVEAVINANQKYLVDHIVDTHIASMKKRGQTLYQNMVDSGRLTLKSAREAKPKDAEPVEEKKKRFIPPPKSELQKAIEEDRKKKDAEPRAPVKHYRPCEIGYDITPLLSQKDFTDQLLNRIPDARSVIAKIVPAVRRFVDDMFNEVLITMTNLALSSMSVAESSKMTRQITFCAIESFFDIICGLATSEARDHATASAKAICSAYERKMEKRREKIHGKPKTDEAAEDEEDEDDEEEDVFEGEAEAAPVVASIPVVAASIPAVAAPVAAK